MINKTEPKITKPHSPKVKKEDSPKAHLLERHIEGIGRRKTAVARVRISKGSGKVTVNSKEIGGYFQLPELREKALSSITNLKLGNPMNISIHVSGGGLKAQAEAIRHGLARALVIFDGDLKKRLRQFGFLTRDSRMVERKKFGLKKARRAPQWKKR
ncbi:MAG: 30S ribosomal protein S9 [Patescibacteria group bacterium]